MTVEVRIDEKRKVLRAARPAFEQVEFTPEVYQ